MKPDEFLALIDKHPLPWTLGGDCGFTVYWNSQGDLTDTDIPLGFEKALADAAPAMAAAILRFLDYHGSAELLYEDDYGHVIRECCQEDADSPHAQDCTYVALRDALPQELRP